MRNGVPSPLCGKCIGIWSPCAMCRKQISKLRTKQYCPLHNSPGALLGKCHSFRRKDHIQTAILRVKSESFL